MRPWLLLLAGLACAAPYETPIGLPLAVPLEWTGPALRIREALMEEAAPRVWIRLEPRAGGYTAWVTPMVPGPHDVGPWIEQVDGQRPEGLVVPPVIGVSVLGAQRLTATGLLEPPAPPLLHTGGYRAALRALLAVWLAIPLLVGLGRLLERRGQGAQEAPRAEVRAGRIRALSRAVLDDKATAAQRGALELLLLEQWRAELGHGPGQRVLDSLGALRAHPSLGATARLLERWLHTPAGSTLHPDEAEVRAALRPFTELQAKAAEAGS